MGKNVPLIVQTSTVRPTLLNISSHPTCARFPCLIDPHPPILCCCLNGEEATCVFSSKATCVGGGGNHDGDDADDALLFQKSVAISSTCGVCLCVCHLTPHR